MTATKTTVKRARAAKATTKAGPVKKKGGAAGTGAGSKSGKAAADRKGSAGRSRTKKDATDKKPSALTSAVQVLAEADGPMTCREIVEAMAAKGYWASPAGKSPHATLYSAILREIIRRGPDSWFRKADRGKFSLCRQAFRPRIRPPTTPHVGRVEAFSCGEGPLQ
jgi:hypothetical protein